MSFPTKHLPRFLLLGSISLILAGCGDVEQPPPPAREVAPFDASWTVASDAQLQTVANGRPGVLVGTLRAQGSNVELGTMLVHPGSASADSVLVHATASRFSSRLEIAVDPEEDAAIGVVADDDDDHQMGLVFAMDASGAPVGATVEVPLGAALPLVQHGSATFLSTDAASGVTTIFALDGGAVAPVATVALSGQPVARLALSNGSAIVTAKRTEGYFLDAITLVRLDAGGHVLDEQPIGDTFAIDAPAPVLGVTRESDGSSALAIVPDYLKGQGTIVRVDPTGTVDSAKTTSIPVGGATTGISLAKLGSGGFLVVTRQNPSTGIALEARRIGEDGTADAEPYLLGPEHLYGGTSLFVVPFDDRAVVVHDIPLANGRLGIAAEALTVSP